MTYGEAIRLVGILIEDPSSMLASQRAGWKYPVTRETAVLMDLFDLQHMSKAKKKPPPYQRPWSTSEKRRIGRTTLSREQVIAVLRRHGHN